MMLDGERLSYRTLDVEQIGSVYEAVMGFRIEWTTGRSIAVRSRNRTGAAVVVDLDGLLKLDGGKRAKALQDAADQRLTGDAAAALRNAATPADIVAALGRKIDRDATPDIVPTQTPVLQPTDERRRSGSHYTPRSLTAPLVAEALRPAFDRLGPSPAPAAILDLKALDPAAGSGAFLVEACRQLAAKLVEAWSVHGGPPDIPPDEDELLHARRLVGRRCLYGVDKNPMAVDLARLSLWLATFAGDHEFSFIDHALRRGDSLLGLTPRQIEGFHWKADAPPLPERHRDRPGERAYGAGPRNCAGGSALPARGRPSGSCASFGRKRSARCKASAGSATWRWPRSLPQASRRSASANAANMRTWLRAMPAVFPAPLADMKPPLAPFHWELEFPEVFNRENPGFDSIVGNPPFAGKNTVAKANVAGYPDWLKQMHAESHGNADLAAHFFRRSFALLRTGGGLGLIATNTIGQGDTRATGLRWICKNGGAIYNARRRIKWPGEVAVVVSVVHIAKGLPAGPKKLDGREVETISAFLFHRGGHDDPALLKANARKSFQGSIVLGMGFTFDDTDSKGIATPLAAMQRLIDENPRNREIIFPYIGGEEVNTSPTHKHHRYVVNFRDYPLRREDLGQEWRKAGEDRRREWLQAGIAPPDYPDPVAADWPELLTIVEEKVKPERDAQNDRGAREKWWQFIRSRPKLHVAITGLGRVLAISRVGQQAAFTFLPKDMIYADGLIVFPYDTYAAFCALQSRAHEIWARFFGSSMKDDLRYTPSECFETFPFPDGWATHPALEAAGREYYEFRAGLMLANGEGLTKTYNRFHDPEERSPQIAKLRELHAAMDRAVLDTYGWRDIATDCAFLLDYAVDEEAWGKKKKPWRRRWPDAVRDEILSRLLALNAERARQERRPGAAPGKAIMS